jgi:hypothetical protein
MAAAFPGPLGRGRGPGVSAIAGVLVLASGVQGGHAVAPARETLLIALAIALLLFACVLIFIHLRRGRQQERPVTDQWQALAVMGELCAHGWQAQVTLYGWGAPVPADAPASRVPLVELEWKQYEEESGQVAVARRVWAPTISEALEMMVEDRRTDLAFEEIEQAAADEGEEWWSD